MDYLSDDSGAYECFGVIDYVSDDSGEYADWAVPNDDARVVDETEEVAQRDEDYDDYDVFDSGCYHSKDSIEKAEIKHVTASKTFTCNGNANSFFERLLLQSVERPSGTVNSKHVVEVKEGQSVLAHSLYLLIESLMPFSCDTYWVKRWVKCDACFQKWPLRQNAPAARKRQQSAKKSRYHRVAVSSPYADALHIEVVDYSEWSLALFGDTKPIEEGLKELGAVFNRWLTKGDGKAAGWIVRKRVRSKLNELLRRQAQSTAATPEEPKKKKAKRSHAAEEEQSTGSPITTRSYEVVDYSESSLAVFGDTKPIKEELKALGAKFNSRLTKGDGTAAGWIVPKTERSTLDELLGRKAHSTARIVTPAKASSRKSA